MQPTASKPGHNPGFVLLISLAKSYRISPYLKAALALNLKTLLVSNSRYSLVPEIAQGITVDFADPAQARSIVLEAIKDLNIKCVLATEDYCVSLSNDIAQQLGLPHNQASSTILTQRKDLAREAARSFGCNTPEYQIIELQQPDQYSSSITYPVVIKPLSLSSSKGVIRANNPQQFNAACLTIDRILSQSNVNGYERNHALVEGYLDGPEFAIDGILIDGDFHLLAIFDKPEPLTGPYFEETYYLTPSQLTETNQTELIHEVSQYCTAYGLTQGPVHAEARITENGIFLIELAARTIGGQCGQLIEFSLQQKLEEIVVRGLCGKRPNLPQNALCAGVLMIPVKSAGILKRVEGLTAAMQVEFIKDIEIHIQEGYELIPLPEGSNYLGFMFAQAPTFEQTFDALKKAHQMLNFVTQPIFATQPIWELNRNAS
jgi:hypothetical protein